MAVVRHPLVPTRMTAAVATPSLCWRRQTSKIRSLCCGCLVPLPHDARSWLRVCVPWVMISHPACTRDCGMAPPLPSLGLVDLPSKVLELHLPVRRCRPTTGCAHEQTIRAMSAASELAPMGAGAKLPHRPTSVPPSPRRTPLSLSRRP